MAALFTIAKTWKQPKYPLIDEWIKKMWGSPHGSRGKESDCNAGDPGSVSGSGRSPGEGNGNPLQHSGLEKSHGRRSLVGYSPWGCKEVDTTKWCKHMWTIT